MSTPVARPVVGRRKPTLREKRIEAAIIRNLKMLGFFVSKLSQFGKPRGMTLGVPDLFACHHRWGAIWIEVKAPPNKCTTAQIIWHREARAAGQNVIVATCMDDVLTELRRLGAPIQ